MTKQDLIEYYKGLTFGYGCFDSMRQAEEVVYALEHGKDLGDCGCPPSEFLKEELCGSHPKVDLGWLEQMAECNKCWNSLFD